MTRTPPRATTLRGTDLIQAWLDVGALSGAHPSELSLPPEQDRVIVGARRLTEVTPDTLRLRVDLRWQARHRARLEEWRGDLDWQVTWRVTPAGLELSDPVPLEESHATLYAWGAAAARLDLATALIAALAEAWAAPVPLELGCAAFEPDDPLPLGVTAGGLSLTVPATALKVLKGFSAKKELWRYGELGMSAGGVTAPRPVSLPVGLLTEVRAGQVRVLLRSTAQPIDAWHDEVFGVRLELVPAGLDAQQATLVGAARAVRERQARPVTLVGVVRGASGEVDGLVLDDEHGGRATLSLMRARAAAASRRFGPATVAAGVELGPAERASFLTWGLITPPGGAG